MTSNSGRLKGADIKSMVRKMRSKRLSLPLLRNEKAVQTESFRDEYPTHVQASFVTWLVRTSWVKSFGQALETLENKHSAADIHDPNAGTSMTPGGCNKTSGRKTLG